MQDVKAQFGHLPGGLWPDAPDTALVLSVAAPGQERPAGLLVVGISPLRALDDAYRGFLDLVVGHIASTLANARAYEAERQRAEALAELDRAKTAFFTNVSHEFRTPLTLILSPVEELLEAGNDMLSSHAQEQLAVVHRNGLRLLKLVNTLLDFARIEAGRIQAIYEPVNLATLTTNLASVFRSATERAGLRLVVDCPPLPAPVYVDREMWEKIVLNLLSNAFKFTFEGEIAISQYWNNDEVVLAVRDTGVGIAPEHQPHIFERFQRIRGVQARTLEGTGIGLALVQELVRLHGGSITVQSAIGIGSTFTVTIPTGNTHLPAERIQEQRTLASIALGAAPYLEEALRWLPENDSRNVGHRMWEEQAMSIGPVLHTPHPPGSTLHILIADDNADMRDYLVRLLGQHYRVTAVADGTAALEVAHAEVPDLIVSDIMMPGLDGFALLRALRDDTRTRTIPIILLSARAGEEARVEGLEQGADDYLTKPFSARELLARVSTHLELASLRWSAAERERVLREQADAARIAAERTADLLARIQTVTTALSRALTPAQVVDVVVHQSVAVLGAYAGGLTLRTEHDDALEIAGAIGYSSETLEHYRRFPLAMPSPLMDALQTKELVILESRADWVERYPNLIQQQSASPTEALIVVPLVIAEQAVGALALSFLTPRTFDADDRAFLGAIAQHCAQALDRARLYEAERQARAEAQEAVRVREAFLSIAAHELKNPLTPLLGQAQLLQRHMSKSGTATDRELRAVEAILDQARRLVKMIDTLLDISRLERGHFTLEHRPVDVCVVIRRVVSELRPTLTKHTLTIQLPDTPMMVSGEELRLEQVFQNLLGNAVKYSPDGGLVTVQVEQRADQVYIAITDQGIGIPAASLPYLFRRFYRAENAGSKYISGIGVGLYIVKELVEAHGGRVTVESVEGQGSTFTVCLPCLPATG